MKMTLGSTSKWHDALVGSSSLAEGGRSNIKDVTSA